MDATLDLFEPRASRNHIAFVPVEMGKVVFARATPAA
jgi:hypothetical protein